MDSNKTRSSEGVMSCFSGYAEERPRNPNIPQKRFEYGYDIPNNVSFGYHEKHDNTDTVMAAITGRTDYMYKTKAMSIEEEIASRPTNNKSNIPDKSFGEVTKFGGSVKDIYLPISDNNEQQKNQMALSKDLYSRQLYDGEHFKKQDTVKETNTNKLSRPYGSTTGTGIEDKLIHGDKNSKSPMDTVAMCLGSIQQTVSYHIPKNDLNGDNVFNTHIVKDTSIRSQRKDIERCFNDYDSSMPTRSAIHFYEEKQLQKCYEENKQFKTTVLSTTKHSNDVDENDSVIGTIKFAGEISNKEKEAKSAQRRPMLNSDKEDLLKNTVFGEVNKKNTTLEKPSFMGIKDGSDFGVVNSAKYMTRDRW